MSAPDRAPGAILDGTALPDAPRRYGTIVVVGGGCYGSYYVRQLQRAVAAGALRAARIVVVDRDPDCVVARGAPPGHHDGRATAEAPHPRPAVDIVVAPWDDFFARWLGAAADDPVSAAADAIVPSPLMPHLVYGWLLARARTRWPGRAIGQRALPRAPTVPWERGTPAGTHYASFAQWMCPINCIEPVLCPHLRGPRTWSLPDAVRTYVRALEQEGTRVDGPILLHCLHRAFGVGMFDVADVLAGDALVTAAGTRGEASVLVGTVSHCHGALDLLHLGA